jgi:iron(III) transport system substrate-binding protein
MASMGEVDIAIVVHSEASRYVRDGFPLEITYPEDGTAYLLTGVGLVRGAVHGSEAKQFIDWLTQDGAHLAMEQHKFYFIPTNPETRLHREYAVKNIQLIDHHDMYLPEHQRKLLDKWVQAVRLGIQ